MAFYITSIILFDSGNLITREAVERRWTLATLVLIINTLAWYFASTKRANKSRSHMFTIVLIGTMLAYAGFSTYWERGMASTSTIFYAFPILIAATLHNRHVLIATTALSVITYSYAAVKYFNDFFNEGFRIQLWGHLVLYAGTLFAVAWIAMILVGLRKDSK